VVVLDRYSLSSDIYLAKDFSQTHKGWWWDRWRSLAHGALVLEVAEVLAVVVNTHKLVAVAFVIGVASVVICVVHLYISREEVSK
jgi:hypothetical protein